MAKESGKHLHDPHKGREVRVAMPFGKHFDSLGPRIQDLAAKTLYLQRAVERLSPSEKIVLKQYLDRVVAEQVANGTTEHRDPG